MNQQLLENFVAPVYSKTPRNQEAYRATYRYCHDRLVSVLDIYRNSTNDQQTLRLVRDDMDNLLRRYHEYCIKQRDGMGAHYHEIGADVETDFEHLIPAARIRDLMIVGLITIDQALNCPTVKLSREKHHLLKESGWGSHTPSVWNPWQRYTDIFNARFRTHDGTDVDLAAWTLDKHYEYYNYLIQQP
jgi:hypothetical protein